MVKTLGVFIAGVVVLVVLSGRIHAERPMMMEGVQEGEMDEGIMGTYFYPDWLVENQEILTGTVKEEMGVVRLKSVVVKEGSTVKIEARKIDITGSTDIKGSVDFVSEKVDL